MAGGNSVARRLGPVAHPLPVRGRASLDRRKDLPVTKPKVACDCAACAYDMDMRPCPSCEEVVFCGTGPEVCGAHHEDGPHVECLCGLQLHLSPSVCYCGVVVCTALEDELCHSDKLDRVMWLENAWNNLPRHET